MEEEYKEEEDISLVCLILATLFKINLGCSPNCSVEVVFVVFIWAGDDEEDDDALKDCEK